MNDKTDNKELLPSQLIFRYLPRFHEIPYNVVEQEKRMKALSEARREMESVTTKPRIGKSLLSCAPRNVEVIQKPVHEVKIYDENNRINIARFPVLPVDGKQILVLQNDK